MTAAELVSHFEAGGYAFGRRRGSSFSMFGMRGACRLQAARILEYLHDGYEVWIDSNVDGLTESSQRLTLERTEATT